MNKQHLTQAILAIRVAVNKQHSTQAIPTIRVIEVSI